MSAELLTSAVSWYMDAVPDISIELIDRRLSVQVGWNDDSWRWLAVTVVAVVLPLLLKKLKRSSGTQLFSYTFGYKFPAESLPDWKPPTSVPIGVSPIPLLRTKNEPEMIQCYCPATGAYLGRIRAATKADIDSAVSKCKTVQEAKWKNTTFEERKHVLRTLLGFLKKNQEKMARVACRDSGKTMVDAALGEILVTLEKLSWTIKYGEDALKPSKRVGPANLLIRYKDAEVIYEPLGVVLALVSWNYPLHNLLNPIISALFSGNGIVVKCSEQVVWSSTHFIAIVRSCLVACGHSPDIVQLVCPWPEDTDYLTAHPSISQVTFIGSKPVAHKVLNAAAKSLTPVTVELGGKDAAIVLDEYQKSWKSCDALASVLMRGSFQSAGQNCIGIERIVAEPKAYEALVSTFKKRVPILRIGSVLDEKQPVDMGAMISDARFSTLKFLIDDAVHHGAKLLCGGQRYKHLQYKYGSYFEPTLLIDVTPEMLIARTELFAPIMVMMKATSVDDAIRIANAPDFGLGGSVFGKRGSKATERVVREMKTGNVAVNDFATFYVCQLPFGGVKGSGYGKFGGEEGLRALCLAKSVCRDKYPLISTSIPGIVDYPLMQMDSAWAFVRAMNVASYASGVWEFVWNLILLVWNLK
ncbi:Aldedh-domain-containing protein [Myxozyma melibiosi]|uniref:Aldedh-domain-containing protein n=1 Tax=Myxozyma melibiosi TaxID=54550 RepID=A0ABR1EZC3_9ASCO